MNFIDGKSIAAKVLEESRQRAAVLAGRGIQAGLAMVLVGNDPASGAYVENKERTSRGLGLHSRVIRLPEETTQATLLSTVAELNNDPAIHGILAQSPPPPHIDEAAVARAIHPDKDVDGFHPVNVAKLTLEDPSGFVPCTPLGCMRLLEEIGFPTSGVEAVVVGRSMIVGKPLALLLCRKGRGGDATVTLAHSRTRNLAGVTRRAELVIAAVGRPHFLGPDHIRKDAVVIDVGINRVKDTSLTKGYRLVGDVNTDAVAGSCRAITPVPGGVGPMTIAMLMQNTITACERFTK